MSVFFVPVIFTIIGLTCSFILAGSTGITLVILLMILEISLSFDNAVLNAAILKNMAPIWQKRFLTWGILVAVFIVRGFLPILLVAFIANLSPSSALKLAIFEPNNYYAVMGKGKPALSAFGGCFLLMVFWNFICDPNKKLHWLSYFEKLFSKIARISGIDIIITTLILYFCHLYAPDKQYIIILSGLLGIGIFIFIQGLINLFKISPNNNTSLSLHSSAISFLYLEILDASFSLDGILGGLAITNNIILLLLGLAIGAFYVRAFTIYMVKKETLSAYRYLEHGAHYAIGALGMIMLCHLFTHISEIITGIIGLLFIALSVISSIMNKDQQTTSS